MSKLPYWRMIFYVISLQITSLQINSAAFATEAAETHLLTPIRAWVSVIPHKTFVERVGGTQVSVESLVQPGYDPHAYEPTPQQIQRLTQAQVYFKIGLPLETLWLSRILAFNPHLVIVEVPDNIIRPDTEDPHIWLNPRWAQSLTQAIYQQLLALRPQAKALFSQQYEQFQAELATLDQTLKTLFQPLQQRQFIVFHPAWGHFAQAYGLTQIAIEHEGKEPTPQQLHQLIQQAQQLKIQTVFIQPSTNPKAALSFAQAISGQVVTIDDLAADYSANLQQAAEAIAKALQPPTLDQLQPP